MISFIIPAHNEEACLGATLRALHESMRLVDQPYETIVVDDASTDRTPEIAREHGATVVSVQHRQIAATRNSGARAAQGARFFFVDADTAINPDLISAALRAMDAGAAGGGAWTRLEGDVPWYARLIWLSFIVAGHFVGFTGGAFMFCTRAAFPASGGFDERMFGGEEFGMAQTLKRHGPFVVLWQRALTSGRRFRKNSGLELLAMARALFWPARALGRRSSVEKIWYDSNRAEDAASNGSWRRRLSNALTLVIVVILLMPPVWALIAALWPAAMHSFPGTIRRTCGIFTVHAGLILWVFAAMLVRALVSQPRWPERVRFALLAAFCLWQAGRATQAVVQLWLQALAWING